jgi:hypothetical protein
VQAMMVPANIKRNEIEDNPKVIDNTCLSLG